MRESIELGPVPTDEECQQVGTANYSAKTAREECQRYIELLRKKFGPEPQGASLKITSNPHDFGTYYEVACFYVDEETAKYAFCIEWNQPTTWDDDKFIDYKTWERPASPY